MFNKLEETSKNLIKMSTIISFVFLLSGLIFLNDNAAYAKNISYIALVGGKIPFALGALIGMLFTILRIVSIDYSVRKSVAMDASSSKLYAVGQYFFRFALTVGFLVGAMLIPQIGFAGAVATVLSLQLSGHLLSYFNKPAKNQNL